MILMIDNYDSFTFNLVQYFQQLDCEVVVRRNDEISLTEIRDLAPSQMVISLGPVAQMRQASHCKRLSILLATYLY